MASLFAFPNPVNEKAARVVAAGVGLISIVALATGAYWLLVVLAYGFIARVLTGPTLSPLGRLATSLVAPRLGDPKPVPGPPKRFAQGIGAFVTTTGAICVLAGAPSAAAIAALALIVLAAGLESIFAVCVGCQIFALAMRRGLIPASVCAECANLTLRGRPA
jgi:hypothetical protein